MIAQELIRILEDINPDTKIVVNSDGLPREIIDYGYTDNCDLYLKIENYESKRID